MAIWRPVKYTRKSFQPQKSRLKQNGQISTHTARSSILANRLEITQWASSPMSTEDFDHLAFLEPLARIQFHTASFTMEELEFAIRLQVKQSSWSRHD